MEWVAISMTTMVSTIKKNEGFFFFSFVIKISMTCGTAKMVPGRVCVAMTTMVALTWRERNFVVSSKLGKKTSSITMMVPGSDRVAMTMIVGINKKTSTSSNFTKRLLAL